MSQSDLSIAKIYLRSGSVLVLAGVKENARVDDGVIYFDQTTQGEKLVGGISLDNIEAVTLSPMVPDCDWKAEDSE